MPHFKEIIQLYFSALLSYFAFRVTATCLMDKIGWTGSEPESFQFSAG